MIRSINIKCNPVVLGGSYTFQVFTKAEYGDNSGYVRDKLPHPKQKSLVFVTINLGGLTLFYLVKHPVVVKKLQLKKYRHQQCRYMQV